jgi:hypothetical protein
VKAGHENQPQFRHPIHQFGAYGHDLAETGAYGQAILGLAVDFAGKTVDAVLRIVGQVITTHARVSSFGLQSAVRDEAIGPNTFFYHSRFLKVHEIFFIAR